MYNCKPHSHPPISDLANLVSFFSRSPIFSARRQSVLSLLHSPQCSVPIIHAYSACTFGSIKQNALIELTLQTSVLFCILTPFVFLAQQKINWVKSLLRCIATWEYQFCCYIYKFALFPLCGPLFLIFHVLSFDCPSWLLPR